MDSTILLPAIRSYVGDWIFYATTLSFDAILRLVKEPDEIHERKKLSEWIQREAINAHSEAISDYIINNEQRFLGSIIIGVYGGSPNWTSLRVKFPEDNQTIPDEQKDKIEGKLGILHLSGEEKLFAIDGQHRVAGIKKALEKTDMDSSIKDDYVSAIFVSHDASSQEGIRRTRRLFTTVNKKAKQISKAALIALDEDNGFAVVTRELIDEYWLFEDEREHLSYTSGGAISPNDEKIITSVVGLFEIIKDLYPRQGKKDFQSQRPTDTEIKDYLNFCVTYLETLMAKVDEYREVFIDNTKKVSDYRETESNHMLFRPIGQRVFSRSVQLLISRGKSLEDSVDTLLSVNMYLNSEDWHHILWDPIDHKMITKKVVIAETRLLTLAGEQPRTNSNLNNLQKLLDQLVE